MSTKEQRAHWKKRPTMSYTQDEFRAVERRMRGVDTPEDTYLIRKVWKRISAQLALLDAARPAEIAEAAE